MTYQREIREVLEGCNVKQRDFILHVIRSLREGLRILLYNNKKSRGGLSMDGKSSIMSTSNKETPHHCGALTR